MKGAPAAVSDADAAAVLAAAAPFQNGYLATALARMTDAVSAAFPGGARALPTSAELQKCIGCAPALSDLAWCGVPGRCGGVLHPGACTRLEPVQLGCAKTVQWVCKSVFYAHLHRQK